MAHAAVPVDKDEFCKAFFPAPTDPAILEQKPKLAENPFAELLKADRPLEIVVRRLFTKAVNDHNLVPGFKMCECGERPDPSTLDSDKQKVDAAFYHAEHAPTDGRQAWPDQAIPVEFKRDENSLDPWDDSKGEDISSEAATRKKGRGQCVSYSELLHAVQHRVALFMLVVVGKRARFVRWDRSGTIVTRSFDYTQEWEFFCDILWRISLCSDEQLGVDPTATRLRPGDADYDRMTEAAKEHADDVDEKERELEPCEIPADDCVYKYVRKMFTDSVLSPWPRYRVEVPVGKDNEDDEHTEDDKTTRHFLIAKPTFRARGMSGRGTRGYVALDCQTGKFMWLKDAWRAHYLLVDKEGDVLRRLNKAGVRHVPTLICHGDIEDQVTLTPDWWEAKNPLSLSQSQSASHVSASSSLSGPPNLTSSSASRKRKCDDDRSEDSVPPPKGLSTGLVAFRTDCPLRLHKHYRLVEKEVGMPLSNFEHGRQLVSVVLDCIYAHSQAATMPKVPILHRDVSGGNILIIPSIIKDDQGAEIKWMGLLTDWEMSKPRDGATVAPGGRQPERTGTWQFLSVALLSRPKEVEICDELEAFFYVILYYGVRYLRSNIGAVGHWISSFFDTYGVHGDTYICGNEKLSTIKTGMLTVAASNTGDNTSVAFDSPLDGVIAELLRWFKANFIWSEHERRVAHLNAKALIRPSKASAPLRHGRDNPSLAGVDDTVLPQPSRPLDNQPSAEDDDLRKHLRTHNKMMGLLKAALASYDWTGDDKMGDRVGSGYRPPAQELGPTLPVSLATNKRRKVDEARLAMSLPLLPLASRLPPKTPERKKTAGPPNHTMGYGQ